VQRVGRMSHAASTGVASIDAAARFCPAHDAFRTHLRTRTYVNEAVPLTDQRRLFQVHWEGHMKGRCDHRVLRSDSSLSVARARSAAELSLLLCRWLTLQVCPQEAPPSYRLSPRCQQSAL